MAVTMGKIMVKRRGGEVRQALWLFRAGFAGIAVLSCFLNILLLTGSFYMLEVYDRVLTSGSMPTLVGLALIALLLYAFQCGIDIVRGRLLIRIGTGLDEILSRRAFHAVARLPFGGQDEVDSIQPSRDLDALRNFVSGPGPSIVFDLPWMPLYLAICFAFHPAIGWTATVGGLLLVALALAVEFLSSRQVQTAYEHSRRRFAFAADVQRNAEVVRVMGMERRLGQVWENLNLKLTLSQQASADITSMLNSVSKITRLVLQSSVLTVGAYLVIHQEATGGIIIASSILTARALAPLELAIGHWKSFVSARGSWVRLTTILERLPERADLLDLPAPCERVTIEALSVAAPNARTLILQNIGFELKAGDGLGIIGPSASGKSTLARSIVGAWPPVHGTVRLDGASLQQWSDSLGTHIGFLPQDVQLFSGTIAENISRFDPDCASEEIVRAAGCAGVHDMIVNLPDGYQTRMGEGGSLLSAGQRQRIGLARALFGNPFLVVLDEPNSNLDAEGEQALTQAILATRLRGGVVIVVAHRPSALVALNHVLVLNRGRIQSFGERDEVLGTSLVDAASLQPVKPQTKPVDDTRSAEAA